MKKLLPRRLEKDTITNGLKRSTRGGPDTLEELKLTILVNDSNYLVINKGPDTRLDGVFDATIEKAVRSLVFYIIRDFLDVVASS